MGSLPAGGIGVHSVNELYSVPFKADPRREALFSDIFNGLNEVTMGTRV